MDGINCVDIFLICMRDVHNSLGGVPIKCFSSWLHDTHEIRISNTKRNFKDTGCGCRGEPFSVPALKGSEFLIEGPKQHLHPNNEHPRLPWKTYLSKQ